MFFDGREFLHFAFKHGQFKISDEIKGLDVTSHFESWETYEKCGNQGPCSKFQISPKANAKMLISDQWLVLATLWK